MFSSLSEGTCGLCWLEFAHRWDQAMRVSLGGPLILQTHIWPFSF